MNAWKHLGMGWGFPILPDRETGDLPVVRGPEKVSQSILLILETERGERLMRPDFGAGLRRFLMKPNTVSTRKQIEREVTISLTRFEPRIELQRVTVSAGADPALALIEIEYVHKRDRSPANLVYPFYLE